MLIPELEKYIKESLEQGIPELNIKSSLRSAGWQESDINEGFNKVKPSQPQSSFQSSPQEEIKVLNINETGKTIGKSNKKFGKIILISVIIIVLAVGGYFGYKYLISKNIFNRTNINEMVLFPPFKTFGDVKVLNGEYILTESDQGDAGISKDFSFPDGVNSISFEYRFTKPGDGDSLEVYFKDKKTGEEQLVAQGPDLNISRENYIELSGSIIPTGMEIEASLPWLLIYEEEKGLSEKQVEEFKVLLSKRKEQIEKNQWDSVISGQLIFKLKSKGNINAELSLKSIMFYYPLGYYADKKIKDCDSIISLDGSGEKEACYFDIAQFGGDSSALEESTCKQMTNKDNIDTCLKLVASSKKNIDICEGISNQTVKHSCYSAVAVALQDLNICNLIPTESVKQSCYDSCYKEMAKYKKDLSLCSKITSKGEEGWWCYYEVAVAKEDFSICDKITGSNWVNAKCYVAIAIAKKDPNLCRPDKMGQDCYRGMFSGNKDISLCDRTSSQEGRDMCYLETASNNKDSTLCANIKGLTWQTNCYYPIAISTKDSSLCSKIPDSSYKRMCFFIFGIWTEPEKNQGNNSNQAIEDPESRDSVRISDLKGMSAAINLWLVDTDGEFKCVKGKIYDSRTGTKATDGTGWIPVNLKETSGGSPIVEFPKDPLNNDQYYHSFACDPEKKTFELTTKLESARLKEQWGEIFIQGTQKDLIP